jgi:HK97 family phage portal protein
LEIDGLMKILGFNISRASKQELVAKAAAPVPVYENRGGWIRVFESYAGAWQHNVTVDYQSIQTYHAIFACVTLIASDISKLMLRLMQVKDGIWSEFASAAFSPVLRKPNSYQTRIQFWECWLLSKLIRGNTYVLKVRDLRKVVVALHVLNPDRVKTLVADDGGVYYELKTDNLANVKDQVTVPAGEIIHDRWNCLFHPLVGVSPLVACGIAAMQGMAIQSNQTNFFNNRSMPSGILTAPGAISNETATRLKTDFETNFSGENAGRLAVMGDGLKYEPIAFTSVEMQMIEQLKWTAEVACSVFHVPGYKVGVGAVPANSNVQALNLEYFSQALQRLIEDAEVCMDEGLALPADLGTEFDTDNLLRMDSVSQIDVLNKASGIMKVDEQRKRLNLPKITGGDTVYLQQQNFSLAALAKRDAREDPFASAAKPAPTPTAPAGDNGAPDDGAPAGQDPAPVASKSFDAAAFSAAMRRALAA